MKTRQKVSKSVTKLSAAATRGLESVKKRQAKATARQKRATADDKLDKALSLARNCHYAYRDLYVGRAQKTRAFEMLQGKALLATVNLLDHVLKDHKGIHDYLRTLTQPEVRITERLDGARTGEFRIADHMPEVFRR